VVNSISFLFNQISLLYEYRIMKIECSWTEFVSGIVKEKWYFWTICARQLYYLTQFSYQTYDGKARTWTDWSRYYSHLSVASCLQKKLIWHIFKPYVVIIFASSPERVRANIRPYDYCGHGIATYCVFLDFCPEASKPVYL